MGKPDHPGQILPGPIWIGIPLRIFAVTFLFTLLSFAVALLLSIMGTIVYSQIKHVAPDLAFAYRHIAFPFAVTMGSIVLLVTAGYEIRNYRQQRAESTTGLMTGSSPGPRAN